MSSEAVLTVMHYLPAHVLCLVCHDGHWSEKDPVVDTGDHESEEQSDTAVMVHHQKQRLFRQEQFVVELWDEPPSAKISENEEHTKASEGYQTGIDARNTWAVLDFRPCGLMH